ncbi:MAG: type II secretion system F family protein [Patescibacteria group bacterium]|nr:type II secretion system F family protein [Patescibacteria group bacterium]
MQVIVPFAKRIFAGEMVDFFKNLSLMVKSGIPIDEALQILLLQTRSSTFKSFLKAVSKQVKQGSSLSKAFLPYRRYLSDLVINIVKAGEINGTLEGNMHYIADILTRRRELKQRLSNALLYPEIVLVMAFMVGGGISVMILPKLIPLFRALNVDLPLASRILLGVSVFLQQYGLQLLPVAIFVVILLTVLSKIYFFRWLIDTVSLRLPFFGRLVKNYQLALFCQLFGTLFKSGLPIKDAMVATSEAMTNVRYRNILTKATSRVTSGTPLSATLKRYTFYFPQNMISIIAVGETSGRLEESFGYLATYYENEVDVQTKRLPTLIEPLLLLVIGLIVAFVAAAIISPIYEITSGIKAGR